VENFAIESTDGTVRPRGELDAATAPQLLAAFSSHDGLPVTLDLAALTFMDSAGVQALITIKSDHEGVRIVNPQPMVRRVINIVGLAQELLDE
jgi:anti-anti-sigma factor